MVHILNLKSTYLPGGQASSPTVAHCIICVYNTTVPTPSLSATVQPAPFFARVVLKSAAHVVERRVLPEQDPSEARAHLQAARQGHSSKGFGVGRFRHDLATMTQQGAAKGEE